MVGAQRNELWSGFTGPSRVMLGKDPVKQSGAYLLAGGRGYLANASPSNGAISPLFDLKTQPADLFGPRLVWRTRTGRVLYRIIGQRDSTRELLSSGAKARSQSGALGSHGWTIMADRGARSGRRQTRYVTAPSVSEVRLSEQVLSWTDTSGEVHLLDLASTPSSVIETGLRAPYQIDNDLLAGLDSTGKIRVQELPFAVAKTPVRLISSVVEKSARDGENWTAQFDVTGPVQQVRLLIQRDGRTVRTLKGHGQHGLVDLDWYVRSRSGRAMKPGRYTYVLTGVLPTSGRGTVHGNFRVTG